MDKTIMPRALAVACLLGLMSLTVAGAAKAQGEPYLELLRSDVQAEKVAIMTEGMMLTSEQGEKFWPIYRDFQTEFSKLGDRRIAMIKEYAANYESLSEETANKIAKEWFSLHEDRLKLMKKTHGQVNKELGPAVAARFIQLENAVQMLIDIQIAAEMPLFPDTKPAE
jgi:hypothetical protein